jgi:hypothetical protein
VTVTVINQTVNVTTQNVTVVNQTIDVTNATCSIGNLSASSISSMSQDVILQMLRNSKILGNRVIKMGFTGESVALSGSQGTDPAYCINGTTLEHITEYQYCTGTSCFPMSDIQNETCIYGCDAQLQKCNDPPYVYNIWIFIGLVVIIIIVLVILSLLARRS